MIELWKGQYGLMTGCEIGVYNRPLNDPPEWALLDRFLGRREHDPTPSHNKFFACANDNELLEMSFTLKRRGTDEGWKLQEEQNQNPTSDERNQRIGTHEMR